MNGPLSNWKSIYIFIDKVIWFYNINRSEKWGKNIQTVVYNATHTIYFLIFWFTGCMSEHPYNIGDGVCEDDTNNEGCSYDGGDCCGPNVDTTYCTECICY